MGVIFLFINLPLLVGGAMFIIIKLMSHYAAYKGIAMSAIPNAAGMLIALPAFFLWIPMALLIANMILWIVSPLRKVAEQNPRQAKHTNFWKSQFQLLILLAGMSVICVPLITYGFLR